MRNKTFFFGVYKDYSENKRIGQLADEIDFLSCEILANPGVIRIYSPGIQKAWRSAKREAKKYNCTHLENMCSNYKIITL